MPVRLVFAHGLEGSPRGAKVQAMRAAGLPVEAPDFRGLVLAERIARLDALTASLPGPLVLAGSSYGGLAAAWLAARHPRRFAGLLLVAPALGHAEEPVRAPGALVAPEGLRTAIVHGRRDRIVPIELSRDYARRSGRHVRLVEVDDDHRLLASLEVVVAEARALVEAAAPGTR